MVRRTLGTTIPLRFASGTLFGRGNLKNDGSKVYIYTQANRLITITATGLNWNAAYNGDGVRLRQTVNSVPTTYTQDLAAPLPVVLQAGTGVTNTRYIFGLDTRPLAEYDTAWEYLLPDGLDSVRQIANASGYIKLTEAYEPYGSVLNSAGSAASIFGFTGEQTDVTGLVFLRARYYVPWQGRFVTRDEWRGNYEFPLSLNDWNYVQGNPVNKTDRTGRCADNDAACWAKAREIVAAFPNVRINMGTGPDWLTGCQGQWFSKHWKTDELQRVQVALDGTLRAFDGDKGTFERAFGTITFARQWTNLADPILSGEVLGQQSPILTGWITIFDPGAQSPDMVDAVIHELGHVQDFREWRKNWFNAPWSYGLLTATNGRCGLQTTFRCWGGYHAGGTTTEYGEADLTEDFAESFRVWVFSKNTGIVHSTLGGTVDRVRLDYIRSVVNYYRSP